MTIRTSTTRTMEASYPGPTTKDMLEFINGTPPDASIVISSFQDRPFDPVVWTFTVKVEVPSAN